MRFLLMLSLILRNQWHYIRRNFFRSLRQRILGALIVDSYFFARFIAHVIPFITWNITNKRSSSPVSLTHIQTHALFLTVCVQVNDAY